jgi:hypothetical protein
MMTLGLRLALLAGLWMGVAGCALGPRAMESGRLRYNEAVKKTTEQQLLLNIVRLRYGDSPSSLSVTTIADQRELNASVGATPFFTSAAAGDLGGYRSTILPQAMLGGAERPTFSYTPNDDQDFARRLFTPISIEGMAYLVRTTWPISTVFRLGLENLNWVENAETASGPTPVQPPVYAEFRSGLEALQRLQDRGLVDIVHEERTEKRTDALPSETVSATAAVDAVRAGYEYRTDAQGQWIVVEKKRVPVLRIGPTPGDDPDVQEFCRVFHLDPQLRKYDLTTESLDPFLEGIPAGGVDVLDLETRSLLQILFFAGHATEIPPEHIACGIVRTTQGGPASDFDWQEVLGGLLRIQSAAGRHPPACAHVAVRYQDYWFYIDERDHDSKATFALLMELSQLELGSGQGTAPLLTIPLGGGR